MQRILTPLLAVFLLLPAAVAHADGPDFTPFFGPWAHHAGLMTVDSAGTVWFEGDAFVNPQGDPPHVIAQLTSVSGNTAYGTFTDGAAFWMTLVPSWDVALVAWQADPPWTLLCGANVPLDLFAMLQHSDLAGASGCGP